MKKVKLLSAVTSAVMATACVNGGLSIISQGPGGASDNTVVAEAYESSGKYSIDLSNVEGRPGEKVSLDVIVECNNDFAYMEASFDYDERLDKPEVTGGTYFINYARIDLMTWSVSSVEDGSVVATFEFTIPSDAKTGTVYDINVSGIKSFGGFNDDINHSSDVQMGSGSITVVGDTEEPVTDPTEEPTSESTTTTVPASEEEALIQCQKGDKDGDGIDDYMWIVNVDDVPSETEIEIPSEYNGYPIIGIGYEAFKDCKYLEKITLPEGLEYIASGAFKGCENLKNINIPESVIEIGNTAFTDTQLIETQSGVQYVDTWAVGCDNDIAELELRPGTVGICHESFQFNEQLEKAVLPDSIKYIGTNAFYNSSVHDISLSKNLKCIGYQGFALCKNLENIVIPDTVTTIGSFAFWNCSSLNDIVVPNSVKFIGEGAFWECDNLSSITFKNHEFEIWGEGFFLSNGYNDDGDVYFNGTIYGYTNSTAQAYAAKYGYRFAALDSDSIIGDANGDDKLNVRDCAFIANALACGKGNTLPENADYNGDGKINVRDAAAIAKFLATGKK